MKNQRKKVYHKIRASAKKLGLYHSTPDTVIKWMHSLTKQKLVTPDYKHCANILIAKEPEQYFIAAGIIHNVPAVYRTLFKTAEERKAMSVYIALMKVSVMWMDTWGQTSLGYTRLAWTPYWRN